MVAHEVDFGLYVPGGVSLHDNISSWLLVISLPCALLISERSGQPGWRSSGARRRTVCAVCCVSDGECWRFRLLLLLWYYAFSGMTGSPRPGCSSGSD